MEAVSHKVELMCQKRKTVLSVTKWTPWDFATDMNLLQRERCKEEKGTLDHIKLQKYSVA